MNACKLLAGVLAAGIIALPGCGGDDDDNGAQVPPPVAKREDFPDPARKTIAELRQTLPPEGPALAPAVSVIEPGRNRFGFGLFASDANQIADAQAAVYLAPAGGGKVRGPFPARYETLEVKGNFQSAGVKADPDSARTVYVADIEVGRPGTYEVLGVVRLDDRLLAATSAGGPVEVVKDSPVPAVGEQAPRTSTPTITDVGGDVAQIDTRVPPAKDLHEEDFADVLGKKPAVLLFATPALCQSKVCGPVVDVAEQVKSERGDEDVAWIHMEIFQDNIVENGFRPQVRQWKLPSEPWLFAVDREGRIAARLEGAFSARELEKAVDAAVDGK